MAVPTPPWRIVIFSTILPPAIGLDQAARALGHEPLAIVAPRLRADADEEMAARWHELFAKAPRQLDLCYVPEKGRLERLVRAYAPDLVLCVGYPWLIPPEVLAIPPLGVLNGHPAALPRRRGPFPLAWAVREGDADVGMTFHLMDEAFDTGPVLAQGTAPLPDDCDWPELEPVLGGLGQRLLPEALERLARGERGAPQTGEAGPYAGPFPSAFAELDLTLPREVVRRHVASWRFMLRWDGERGPLATVGGERVRVLRTSLEEPRAPAGVLACADGPLWVLETAPAGA